MHNPGEISSPTQLEVHPKVEVLYRSSAVVGTKIRLGGAEAADDGNLIPPLGQSVTETLFCNLKIFFSNYRK
jgi:hypothetical protein